MARNATLERVRRLYPLLIPLLFAAFPLLALFQHNETELPIGVLWSPLVVVVLVSAALTGLLMLAFKSAGKAGAIASVVIVGFFYYGIFYRQFSKWGFTTASFLPLWVALFGLAVAALLRTRRDLASLSLIVLAGAVVLVLGPVVRIAVYQANHPPVRTSDPHLWATALPNPRPGGKATLPDVYFIVPDDYARADVLRRYFHYDGSRFLSALRKRGFQVSAQVRSPYMDSESNIAAAVNMDYLTGLGKVLGAKSQDVRPVKSLIEDNRASQLLSSLGYRYVHMDTDEVTYAAGNPDISPTATPDSFTSLWLRDSVLRLVGGDIGFSDAAAEERYRETIQSVFSRLAEVPRAVPGPKFVFFHTLVPHDPYVFGAGGRPVTFPDTSETGHGSTLGMRYYLKQLRFLDRKLLETVDAIRARSKTPPIIVIQSDEGFESNPENFGEAAANDIRFKGLLALHLPGLGKRAGVPSPPTTVNTLRYVFNRALGTHYPLLRTRSFIEGDYPYQLEPTRVR